MESFFSSLKKEKIRQHIYNTREEIKAEIFDYIEVFYNRTRRISYLNYLSPVQFEQQQIGHKYLSIIWGEVQLIHSGEVIYTYKRLMKNSTRTGRHF